MSSSTGFMAASLRELAQAYMNDAAGDAAQVSSGSSTISTNRRRFEVDHLSIPPRAEGRRRL